MPDTNYQLLLHDEINWDEVSGPIGIPLTNDYLFRALLQRNNQVLKSSALLPSASEYFRCPFGHYHQSHRIR